MFTCIFINYNISDIRSYKCMLPMQERVSGGASFPRWLCGLADCSISSPLVWSVQVPGWGMSGFKTRWLCCSSGLQLRFPQTSLPGLWRETRPHMWRGGCRLYFHGHCTALSGSITNKKGKSWQKTAKAWSRGIHMALPNIICFIMLTLKKKNKPGHRTCCWCCQV